MRHVRDSLPDFVSRCMLLMCVSFLVLSCGGEETPARTEGATPAAAATDSSQQTADAPIDACALLTKAEVEAAIGSGVLAPRSEQIANLAACSFGDASAPVIDGRATAQAVSLSVFVGQAGDYYAGAVAQARDAFKMGRDNAASDQAVNGLGDDAYWDSVLRTLNVLRGKYEVEVNVSSDAGGLDVARSLAVTALQRLPQN